MAVAPLVVMNTISPDALLQRNANLTGVVLDEEMICLDKNGNCFGLNPTGRLIWEMLDTPKSLKQIMEALIAVFPKDCEALNQDIPPFLEHLLHLSIIVVASVLVAR